MSTIDTPQNSYMKNTILLMAVDRAIVIHDKNFETFLTILKSVQKYEPLCETMSADAKQLGKKKSRVILLFCFWVCSTAEQCVPVLCNLEVT